MTRADVQDVTILMGVRNGAAHLDEQLDSFAAQQDVGWRLIASDDGSVDGSRAILERFAARFEQGRVSTIDGPKCGFAANYLSMLRHLPPDPGALAFSDHDDVWLPERLKLGASALEGAEGPVLYCSRTFVTSKDLSRRRLARGCPRPPGFRHALVQNVAAGNTILANPAAARLLVAAARRTETVVAHDWWAYEETWRCGWRWL
jgi:glycosyltransferase involved in cell wall biosynthesis